MTNSIPQTSLNGTVDLSELLMPYSNQWVALTPDEGTVICSSMSPLEALHQANSAGYPNPIITHVPKNHTPHVI